jgi:hypothetical protein
MPLCMPSPITSALSPSHLLLLPFPTHCVAPSSLSMAGEADQTLHAAEKPTSNEGKSDSGTESDIPMTSSSITIAAIKIANKIVPDMSDYWKKSTIADVDCQAYHDFGWLPDNLISMVPKVDVPTTHDSTMVCFESHLIARLGLLPCKFLVAIMNFLGCEIVHFNPNAITAHSYFSMQCECWLGIAPNTSLFWHFYSPAWYDKVVYSGIGLSVHRHCRKKYIDATFKSSWRGS